MANHKVFLTLKWQDQNCFFLFGLRLTSIIFLSKLLAKGNAPKIFNKHNQKEFITSIKLVLH